MAEKDKSIMQPQEFLLQSFSVAIRHPFAEERLGGQYTAELLKLDQDDKASLAKARAVSIGMVLCLAQRAVTEAFLAMYGTKIGSEDSTQKVAIAGAKLFDSIVESQRTQSDLPLYVDSSYFPRWRMRYESGILENKQLPLKIAVLSTFYSHATFKYHEEPGVNSTEDLIMFFGGDVFDNYLLGFRDLFGRTVLR